MFASARRTFGSVEYVTKSDVHWPLISGRSSLAAARSSGHITRPSTSWEVGTTGRPLRGSSHKTSDHTNRYIARYSPSPMRWLRLSSDVRPAYLMRFVRVVGGSWSGVVKVLLGSGRSS